MVGTENFMTKIKAKNRKRAPAVAVPRWVSRLADKITNDLFWDGTGYQPTHMTFERGFFRSRVLKMLVKSANDAGVLRLPDNDARKE